MELILEKFLEETVRSDEPSGASLEMMNGPEDGRVFPLTKSLTTIGRTDGNDLILAFDPTVSRQHAHVTEEQGSYWIEDRRSTSGTEVDGVSIRSKQELHDGCMILVGETLLCFRSAASPKT